MISVRGSEFRCSFGLDFSCFRAEEVGYTMPTDVQRESLPVLLSGQDCVIHAQVITFCGIYVFHFDLSVEISFGY